MLKEEEEIKDDTVDGTIRYLAAEVIKGTGKNLMLTHQQYYAVIFLLFFSMSYFFQAEDGIRDRDVTGLQTCALPI